MYFNYDLLKDISVNCVYLDDFATLVQFVKLPPIWRIDVFFHIDKK